LAEIAYKKGIKVVWTLHDYKLLCSRHDCLRNEKPCELCFHKKENVLKYNCVKNSRIGSLLGYLESLKWDKKNLEKYTNTFICPSGFMKEKMLSGGFNEQKLKTLCNFTAIKKDITEKFQKEIYYCYVGRLSKEKGVETLLRAAQQHSYLLKIAGNGPLYNDLKEKYASEKIVFLGYLNQKEIKELIEKACFTVIPSEWYENNPLAVIESLSLGTPVLGSDMGGIPELIEPGETGMIFEAKNREDLSEKIKEMFDAKKSFDSERIAKNAMKRFSYDRYYLELMNIYTKA
jgi:glycosyltransferase involved in cell wall biosynthesis